MIVRSVVAMGLLGLAGCVRPVTATESAPPAEPEAVRIPDVDVAPSEPEPETEPDVSAELDPSLIAPIVPEADYEPPLSWEREDAPTQGKAAMVVRAKVLRGMGPDRVRGMRVTVSSRGAIKDGNASAAPFKSVHVRVVAAPGVRFVGGAGMLLSTDRSGIDAKFKSATVGVRRDLDILFVADEDMVGRHPIATVNLEYVRLGPSRERKKESTQKKVFATLR